MAMIAKFQSLPFTEHPKENNIFGHAPYHSIGHHLLQAYTFYFPVPSYGSIWDK